MDTKFFSVYDSAAARFLDPFAAPTAEMAIRGFRQACNRDGHQFNEFAADYTLFQVGEFDAEKGKLSGNTPISLGNALQFIATTPLKLEGTNDGS